MYEFLNNWVNDKRNRYFFYKVVFEDGHCYRDYKFERSLDLFERDGVKLYAYTKDLYPTTILLAWK